MKDLHPNEKKMKKIEIKNRWADTIHPDPFKKIKFAIQMALCASGQNCDWDIDVEQICDTKDVREPHTYKINAKRVISLNYQDNSEQRQYQYKDLVIQARACTILDIFEAVSEYCEGKPPVTEGSIQ